MWQLAERLDVDAMRAAAASLVGTHDFAAFQSVGTDVTSSIRTIFRSEISRTRHGSDARPLGPRSVLVYEVTG